jgi:hypothetical protein
MSGLFNQDIHSFIFYPELRLCDHRHVFVSNMNHTRDRALPGVSATQLWREPIAAVSRRTFHERLLMVAAAHASDFSGRRHCEVSLDSKHGSSEK